MRNFLKKRGINHPSNMDCGVLAETPVWGFDSLKPPAVYHAGGLFYFDFVPSVVGCICLPSSASAIVSGSLAKSAIIENGFAVLSS